MKVVCIKNFKSQALQYELTYGKVYEVQSKPEWADKDSHFIMCDRGYISSYRKECFVTIEEWREKKLNKVIK